MMQVLVTGGTRSGKSFFAEQLCKEKGRQIAYLATAEPLDEEMEDRIKKHREQRPKNWKTIEAYRDINEIFDQLEGIDTLILDCITIYVNNRMYYSGLQMQQASREQINRLEGQILQEMRDFMSECKRRGLHLILVTDELGMGIVPENRLTRIYRDIVGRVNQQASSLSDEVYFVISGIPMKIKELGK